MQFDLQPYSIISYVSDLSRLDLVRLRCSRTTGPGMRRLNFYNRLAWIERSHEVPSVRDMGTHIMTSPSALLRLFATHFTPCYSQQHDALPQYP